MAAAFLRRWRNGSVGLPLLISHRLQGPENMLTQLQQRKLVAMTWKLFNDKNEKNHYVSANISPVEMGEAKDLQRD